MVRAGMRRLAVKDRLPRYTCVRALWSGPNFKIDLAAEIEFAVLKFNIVFKSFSLQQRHKKFKFHDSLESTSSIQVVSYSFEILAEKP